MENPPFKVSVPPPTGPPAPVLAGYTIARPTNGHPTAPFVPDTSAFPPPALPGVPIPFIPPTSLVTPEPSPAPHRTGLLRCPSDIGVWRERFFTLAQPIQLPYGRFEEMWGYVDNMWSRHQHVKSSSYKETSHYRCRKHRKQHESKSTGQRARKAAEAIECGMRLRIVTYFAEYAPQTPIFVVADRMGECERHNHDLDLIDAAKRPSALRKLVGDEVEKGYPPTVVLKVLKGDWGSAERKRLMDAGGAFLTIRDVHNAGRASKKGEHEKGGGDGEEEGEEGSDT